MRNFESESLRDVVRDEVDVVWSGRRPRDSKILKVYSSRSFSDETLSSRMNGSLSKSISIMLRLFDVTIKNESDR